MATDTLPIIGISMGDPAGVGPELCLRAVADARVRETCVPVVFGDPAVLEYVAKRCGLPMAYECMTAVDWPDPGPVTAACVVGCTTLDASAITPGVVQEACGRAAYTYVEAAANAAIDGRIDAMVTAPINKAALKLAGVPFPGHTEILAALTGTRRYCMMMACDELAVSLATIHIAHAQVSGSLDGPRISEVIELTADAMKRVGRNDPLIAVCALNPHGGEEGMFGDEEQQIVQPAIDLARSKGIRVDGPMVPDVAFLPERRREIDAYVVMYHDQGLIPFKMLAFEKGVNITLGLPIVRTSVDHGTAFDIAWQGKASAGSMVEAVSWAVRLSNAG